MAVLPKKNETYKFCEYWDERFSVEDTYEWCKSYDDFKHLLLQYVNMSDKILVLGCGTSSLSEELYKDGYKNIVNVDYSPVVIEKMKLRHHHLEKMKYIVMDITKMTFDVNSFDVVLEKGTLDTLLVEEKDLWNPSVDSHNVMHSILSQISKILKESGRFISVSFSQPHFRKPYLAKSEYNWSIITNVFGDYFHYFFYVMEKGCKLNDKDKMIEQNKGMKILNSFPSITQLEDNDENFLHNINLFL